MLPSEPGWDRGEEPDRTPSQSSLVPDSWPKGLLWPLKQTLIHFYNGSENIPYICKAMYLNIIGTNKQFTYVIPRILV